MNDIINHNEQDGAEQMEEKFDDDFIVIGLGASASGIEAFKGFFTRVEPDSGMAYVVILNLSPERESELPEILQVSARLPVVQVSKPVKIRPDHIYVIQPSWSLSMKDGILMLSEVNMEELSKANDDLNNLIVSTERGLLRHMVAAQEDERKRIARELHDQLGQKLTALRLKLEFLDERCRDMPELTEEVDKARLMLKDLDTEVNFLAWELRPPALDDFGLVEALRNYLQEWSKQFGIPAEFQTSRLEKARLLPEIETSLYRIAQEALNNVYKHAEARRVGVILEQRDNDVILIIEDDGKGFESNSQASDGGLKGIGLIGMRERASLLDGSLEIESAPGKGTTIFALIPISFVESGGPNNE